MNKDIVIDFRYKKMEDINAIQLIGRIINYMDKKVTKLGDVKFIVNLYGNNFTDKTMEIFSNFIIKDERVKYLIVCNNFWLHNNKSRKILNDLDNIYLKKLILEEKYSEKYSETYFESYLEEQLSKWNFTTEKLTILKQNHIDFFMKYTGLRTYIIFKSELYNTSNIRDFEDYEEFDYSKNFEGYYSYYYCKYCYISNILESDFDKHYLLCNSHNCGKSKSSSIEQVLNTNIPSSKILNRIVIANNLSKLENYLEYPENTNAKLSKRILKTLSKRWIHQRLHITNTI